MSFLKSTLRNRSFMIGASFAALFIGAGLLSYLWTPFDVTKLDIPHKLQKPNLVHWFGTDHFGRDIFSMIMVGARTYIYRGGGRCCGHRHNTGRTAWSNRCGT